MVEKYKLFKELLDSYVYIKDFYTVGFDTGDIKFQGHKDEDTVNYYLLHGFKNVTFENDNFTTLTKTVDNILIRIVLT